MDFSRTQPICDVGSKYCHCKDILNFVLAHLSVILAEEVTCFLGLCLASFWVLWLSWAPPCPAGIHAHTFWLLVERPWVTTGVSERCRSSPEHRCPGPSRGRCLFTWMQSLRS